MIGRLRGMVDRVGEDRLLLDVNGVGYVVFASSRTLRQLPGEGEAAILEIETHVREDHIHLYGFADQAEQRWFNTLTAVQGVGTKVALAILSATGPEELTTAILAQDKTPITRASGVGPKLANRIITELKDKVASMPTTGMAMQSAPANTAKGSGARPVPESSEPIRLEESIFQDAVSALVNLGYGRPEAMQAVAMVTHQNPEEATSLDAVIPLALKELSA